MKRNIFKKVLVLCLSLLLMGGILSPMLQAEAADVQEGQYLVGTWKDTPKSDYTIEFSQTPQVGESFILSSVNEYVIKGNGPSGTANYPVYPDNAYNWIWLSAGNPNAYNGEGWYVRGWNAEVANSISGTYPLTIHNYGAAGESGYATHHTELRGLLQSGFEGSAYDDPNAWWIRTTENLSPFISWKSTISSQTVTGSKGANLKFATAKNLVLWCHHITVLSDLSMPANRTDYDTGDKWTNNIKFTVVAVDTLNKTALIHAMVPTASTQAGDAFFNYKYEITNKNYDPIGILLKKKDAGTADDVRPVVL